MMKTPKKISIFSIETFHHCFKISKFQNSKILGRFVVLCLMFSASLFPIQPTIASHHIPPVVSFQETTGTFFESNANPTGDEIAAIQLTGAGNGPITVRFLVSSISAAEGSDYQVLTEEITLPSSPIQTSYSLKIINDTVAESNEKVLVRIVNANGATIDAVKDRFTLTIVDDDPPPPPPPTLPVVSFTQSTGTFLEANADATLTEEVAVIQLLGSGDGPITVQFQVVGIEATSGQDFIVTQTSGTYPTSPLTSSFGLNILPDTLFEGNETVEITIVSATNATIDSAKKSFVLKIEDDDPAPPPASPPPPSSGGSSGGGSSGGGVPQDAILPVIVLKGANPLTLSVGDLYLDPGYTATDNKDGDITADVVLDKSAVNTKKSGTYLVVYTVADSSSNKTKAERTVIVTEAEKEEVITPEPSNTNTETVSGQEDTSGGGSAGTKKSPQTAPVSSPQKDVEEDMTTSTVEATNQPPNAVARRADRERLVTGQSLSFSGDRSTDPDGVIQWYVWSFGDGTPEEAKIEPSASHVFEKPGMYTVTLRVIDDDWAEDTDTFRLVIQDSTDEKRDNARIALAGAILAFSALALGGFLWWYLRARRAVL